jgi:anti-sigma factor (TIGR02949 family)
MKVLNFNASQCERVRRQLDAYLSNELLVETTSEVLRHLESCEACSHELDARTRLRKALRKAADQRVPPEHLRGAIRNRLRSEQPGLFREFRLMHLAVGLASLVLVLVTATQGFRLERGRQLVSTVLTLGVSDHIQCAIKGHNYPEVASPSDQLRKKLGAEYSGLLPIIQQKLPGFEVLEAHICLLPGSPRKYIHFITRGQGTILSVILTKRDGESLPSQRLLVTKDFSGSDLYHAKLEGMSVAGFETDEYFGFVVSDLGQNEILRLAAAIAPPLRDALDRSIGTKTSATPVFLVASVSSGLARNMK